MRLLNLVNTEEVTEDSRIYLFCTTMKMMVMKTEEKENANQID